MVDLEKGRGELLYVGGLARFAIHPGGGGERLTWPSLEPSDDAMMEEVQFLLTSASFLLLFDVWNRPQSGLSIMDQRGV